MRRFGLVVACVFAAVAFASAAFGQSSLGPAQASRYHLPEHTPNATVHDKTLPPIGYVDFCGRAEAECQFRDGKVEALALNGQNWDDIAQVNRYVNTKIIPKSDMELYGKADYWTYPVTAGDCEDYALLKKRYLVGLGLSPDILLMTVVLDEHNEGHAVLTVVTNKGDYILDNRRTEILRWDDTGYKFLKRQSQATAHEWMSLQKAAPEVMVSTKAH